LIGAFGHGNALSRAPNQAAIGRFEQPMAELFLTKSRYAAQHAGQDPAGAAGAEFERLGGTAPCASIPPHRRPSDLSAWSRAPLREDLYYRLNVAIEMPPLRERQDDIVPLANSFIQRFSGELK